MALTEAEIRAITDARLAASRADACGVYVESGDRTNVRFARNSATSNGTRSRIDVTITSHFGQQSGTASVSSLEPDALDKAQRRSEEIARAAPANPELMPPLGPQSYVTGAGFDAATAGLSAMPLAEAARSAITLARTEQVFGAGYVEAGSDIRAMANSNGLFVRNAGSFGHLTVTARRQDGSWSGWGGGSDVRFGALDAAAIAGRAVGKAAHSAAPLDLDPGQYTVILEPSAAGELLIYLLWSMHAREADEGKSWLSAKGGGNRLGEQVFDPRVTLYSDPGETLAPVPIYGEDGVPRERTVWVKDGVINAMAYSRYWAAKTGQQPRPGPSGMVMVGGPTPIEEMIRATKRGILVTRIWYQNMLDPRSLLVTGLTRDGNFLIEDGKVVGPVRNLRFNESLIAMLGNIDAIGPTQRIHGGDIGGSIAAPPLMVKTFNFASRSSGI
jgi:predicted Zn-dependent protease